jgi:hypothetical protein
MNILTVNLLSSTLVFWAAARIYLLPRLGAYWIPAFWVPALLVTHYVAFLVLLRPWPAPGTRAAQAAGRAGAGVSSVRNRGCSRAGGGGAAARSNPQPAWRL